MCGIGGILRIYSPSDLERLGGSPPPHRESIPDAWLDTLDDSIKHRGPDGAGRFRDRARRDDGSIVDVALVHRRLSIIDHAGGHQPMVDARGGAIPGATTIPDHIAGRPHGVVVHDAFEDFGNPDRLADLIATAFNGCIYNHRELRAELEASDHAFSTDHADTEVLIHGWRAHQAAVQEQLDGMYAALIWDRTRGLLAAMGDPAGEKPLYATELEPDRDRASSGEPAGTVPAITYAFSSCVTAISAVCRGRASGEILLDERFIDEWIRYGAHRVISRRCKSIGRGEVEVFGHGGTDRIKRRVALPRRADPGPSFDADADSSRGIMERAVASRLEADVPLGVFLSGGLDSALIASIARRHRPDITAYTVRMPEPPGNGQPYDESRDAAATAAAIGIKHEILDCPGVGSGAANDQPARDLVTLIEQLGLPFGDSSLLPTYWVCKAAREHVRVALSGDGGDELFGGYRRHTIIPLLGRWQRVFRRVPVRLLDQREPSSRPTSLARLAVAARWRGYDDLLSIFPTPDVLKLNEIEGLIMISGPPRPNVVDDPLRYDFRRYLPNDILRKTDTASMAVALEVRAPFLARELVDAAMRTPLDALMPNGERKGLLKQLARDFLPDHVIDRPKRGFAIPIGHWFRTDFGGLRTLLLDHLTSTDPFPGLEDAGTTIQPKAVGRLLREHDAAGERSPWPWHGRDHSQRLYMLLVLSIWCRWITRERAGALAPEASPAG